MKPKKLKRTYCCHNCKGTNIQILAWIDPNTNEYQSDYWNDDTCYCEDCDDTTKLDVKYI